MADIDYKVVLADLEQKKAAIEASIAGIRMMLGQAAEGHATGSSSAHAHSEIKLAPNTFSRMGALEAAEHYLRVINQLKTTSEIASALESGGIVHQSENFKKTISTILNTKARDASSEITKTRDGRWGLSSWGPGMRKAKNANLGNEAEIGTAEEVDEAMPVTVVK